MAQYLGQIFKGEDGSSSNTGNTATAEDDFADFATPSPATPSGAAAESVASVGSAYTYSDSSSTAIPMGLPGGGANGPWYAIWERASIKDFQSEGYILALLFFVVGVHLWGTKRNRKIAKNFMTAILPVVSSEFAYVGFDPLGKANTINLGGSVEGFDSPLVLDAEKCLKETSPQEFTSYASGRQNIACMHTLINLQRRSNPIALFGEYVLSFFFESMVSPEDSVTLTIQPFDGQDSKKGGGGGNSKYDNFVWALVNKRCMKRLREDRYDLSLTKTSDWEGLPRWLAVMGESKEVGDTVLFEELKDAVKQCEDILQYLIITDQPVEKPVKLPDTIPQKRVTLHFSLPTTPLSPSHPILTLITTFIRLVDHLCATARFRPEVTKKIRQIREEQIHRIQKVEDEQKAEERTLKRDEEKKAERDRRLRGMTAEEQRKFLEREREKEGRKGMKKAGKKG